MSRLTGIGLEKVSDETTILNFRQLLERHGLVKVLLRPSRSIWQRRSDAEGRNVLDAGIMAAPSSRKNRKRESGPEMKQTKKGNQWHFGMKLHIGVDDQTGQAHNLARTAANMDDLMPSEELVQGEEERAWGDGGYQGIEKREGQKDRQVAWPIAMRPGQRRTLARAQLEKLMEQSKSRMRAKLGGLFFYVKQIFGYNKTRYRGLTKNENRLAYYLDLPTYCVRSLVWLRSIRPSLTIEQGLVLLTIFGQIGTVLTGVARPSPCKILYGPLL